VRRAVIGVLALLGLLLSCGAAAATAPPRPPLPVFAYYYQWFDPPSWNRAKTDYPLLGRYSSDDVTVMRKQVQMAKAAGIHGFIVSWKSSPVNNRRLRQLVEVARSVDFGLQVIYQGLDFDRNPQPVARVAADLVYFRDTFAADPVFRMLDRPLLIWSGTWKFTREEVASAVAPISRDVQVLASEKDVAGYNRLADVVEGNAYYWSSVDPSEYQSFASRLQEMGEAVHSRDGLWLAPFAPGFDARLVGGTRAVDRRDGLTLREEYDAAVSSSPDVLGLISWNEYSENTHVEPSEQFGNRYLDVLGEIADSPADAAGPLAGDSSEAAGPATGAGGIPLSVLAIGAVVCAVAAGTAAAVLLRRRRAPPPRRGHRRESRLGRLRPGRPAAVVVALVGAVGVGASLLAMRSPEEAAAPQQAQAEPAADYQGAKPVRDPSAVVVAAAGDIACAPDPGGIGAGERNSAISCVAAQTAGIVRAIDPDAVLALGDLQYPDGSLERFRAGYDRTWGAFKAITYPVVGNHEYGTRDAEGYFDYFGAAAGSPDTGYYSYELAGWHVVALNSECRRIGGCGAGSPQQRWLAADLAAHPAECTLAYWHRPRFSSGHHGDDTDYTAFWKDLRDAGAELVLAGHDHDYERFAPLGTDGAPDPRGIREFVVGTGGDSFYAMHQPPAGQEVGIAGRPGVLQLTLRPGGYDWSFRVPQGSTSRTADSGSARCHPA
jgi:Calcineurin-like phosphoesterase/Glycosyl hydrolase family 99